MQASIVAGFCCWSQDLTTAWLGEHQQGLKDTYDIHDGHPSLLFMKS